jgi:hypothetical protein
VTVEGDLEACFERQYGVKLADVTDTQLERISRGEAPAHVFGW